MYLYLPVYMTPVSLYFTTPFNLTRWLPASYLHRPPSAQSSWFISYICCGFSEIIEPLNIIAATALKCKHKIISRIVAYTPAVFLLEFLYTSSQIIEWQNKIHNIEKKHHVLPVPMCWHLTIILLCSRIIPTLKIILKCLTAPQRFLSLLKITK